MRTLSRAPRNIPQSLFNRAALVYEGGETMRRATELVLVHGYAMSHVARTLGIRHRQQVHAATRRMLDIIDGLRTES